MGNEGVYQVPCNLSQGVNDCVDQIEIIIACLIILFILIKARWDNQ